MLEANNFPSAAAALIAKRLLKRHSSHEIAEAVEVLIDVLDLIGGDPDAEDSDEDEAIGDERDCAWIEWHAMAPSLKGVHNHTGTACEDDEDDDAPEEDDPAGQCDEDGMNTARPISDGPGCPCSDPAEHNLQFTDEPHDALGEGGL